MAEEGVIDDQLVLVCDRCRSPLWPTSGVHEIGGKQLDQFFNSQRFNTLANDSNLKEGSMAKRILILCTGNSCRSQMAEGILRSIDPSLEVYSAGTQPAEQVHPKAIQAMKEIGVDISQGRPKNVSQFLKQSFDFVITVCDDADKNCPFFTGVVKRRVHIAFVDPAKATGGDKGIMAVFRQVRDAIKSRFADFYTKEIKNTVA
jgi:arsenate reductase